MDILEAVLPEGSGWEFFFSGACGLGLGPRGLGLCRALIGVREGGGLSLGVSSLRFSGSYRHLEVRCTYTLLSNCNYIPVISPITTVAGT